MTFRKKRRESERTDQYLGFAVDTLEERKMLAVDVDVTGGGSSLRIRGDNTSETVEVDTTSAGVITVNGQSTGLTEIKKLKVIMKGGDDVVSITDEIVVTAKSIIKLGAAGTEGNQLTVGGQHSFLKIVGGKQRDVVTLTAEAARAPRAVNLKGGSNAFYTVVIPGPTGITATIDYSLDTNNFFDTAAKRDVLQLAADDIVANFADDLTAISPSGRNSWSAVFYHPATDAIHSVNNLNVAANELVIYAGGQSLGGNLGEGGPGGFSVGGSGSWIANVERRGESGASGGSPTDFGPWGGAITFDTTVNWHFGETTSGLESDEFDFYSVAQHELSHLFGFGTAPSFDTFVSGSSFTGPKSVAAYDLAGNIPLSSDSGHWANGTTDGGAETALDPLILAGVRREMTPLDYAGLDDIGWDL